MWLAIFFIVYYFIISEYINYSTMKLLGYWLHESIWIEPKTLRMSNFWITDICEQSSVEGLSVQTGVVEPSQIALKFLFILDKSLVKGKMIFTLIWLENHLTNFLSQTQNSFMRFDALLKELLSRISTNFSLGLSPLWIWNTFILMTPKYLCDTIDVGIR